MKTRLLAALMMVGLVLASVMTAPPAFASPSNDSFTGAIGIYALPFHDAKDLGADPPTKSGVGEPVSSCTDRGYYTVWYKIVGVGEWLDLNTRGSNYDTVLTVYQYSNGLWSEVKCNDDEWIGRPPYTSALSFFGERGKQYYIKIGSYGGGYPGRMNLCVDIWDDLPCGYL